MGDTMIQFLFIWVGFCVGLAYAFGDYFPVALLVAGVFAILTLHTSRIFEELAAEGTTHNIIELLKHKLVPVQLVYLFFPLTNGTFTVESNVERSTIFCLFGWKLSDK